MLMIRGLGGLRGLGQEPAPTSGWCFVNGAWRWTQAAGCPNPLIAGGPPEVRAGFCWIRQNPPDAFPGYWQRASTAPCAFEPPPAQPTEPAGFCQDPATGQWTWTLQSRCAMPVQTAPSTPVVRDNRGTATQAGVTVVAVSNQLDSTKGTTITWAAARRLQIATVKAMAERESLAIKALVQTLAPCPAESVRPPNKGCYDHGAATIAQTIPGTFEMFGVPFNVAEPGVTKSPQFERTYTPNNEQRILLECQIIHRSNQILDRAESGADKWSFNEALDRMPRWKPAISGMAMRSKLPRIADRGTPGGFKAWRKSGGFLIWLDLVEGKERLFTDAACPRVCISGSCRCGDFTGSTACISGGVPVSGSNSNLSTGCFWWYAKIDQTAPWQFHLIGKHDDPSWLEKAGDKMASFMTALGKVYCGDPAAMNKGGQPKESNVDKDGKPCTKGTTGCNTVQPSAAAVGGFNLFNALAAKMCANWRAEYTSRETFPPVPDPLPVVVKPTWLKLLPWMLGGLAAGAGAFAVTR